MHYNQSSDTYDIKGAFKITNSSILARLAINKVLARFFGIFDDRIKFQPDSLITIANIASELG
jgi:hypothetical protein